MSQIVFLLIAIGALFLISGVLLHIRARSYRRWPVAEATVTGVETTQKRQPRYRGYLAWAENRAMVSVRYAWAVRERNYEAVLVVPGEAAGDLKPGDRFLLRHSAEAPEKHLATKPRTGQTAIICLVIGAMLVVVGILFAALGLSVLFLSIAIPFGIAVMALAGPISKRSDGRSDQTGLPGQFARAETR